MEEAVEAYRELAKLPSISRGRICNAESPGHVQVYSAWSQRDLERSKQETFARNHIIQLDVVVSSPPISISDEQMNEESPSGAFRAIVRKVKDDKGGEDKQFVEIWSSHHKVHNFAVDKLEQHGQIYSGTPFGCLQWSHSETHLLYVAERKRPKAKSYFDKNSATDKPDETTERGTEHDYHEHWGEQLVGKCHPVVCVMDIEAGAVSVLENLPDDVSAGQAVWCPYDLGIVCTGWYHTPYRLGLIYCPMRRSALFHIDLKTYKCTPLTDTDRSVRSPVFSPDQTKLVYLDNEAGGPHMHCSRLMLCDWATKGIVPVIDVLRDVTGDAFPGIFSQTLEQRCWSSDSRRLIFSTEWATKQEVVIVDCETGRVTKIGNVDRDVGSWQLLDVHRDLVLVACSEPNTPAYMVLGRLPELRKESLIPWKRLTERSPVADFSWSLHTQQVPAERVNPKYPDLSYQYFVMEPEAKTETDKYPLVVACHGGPHTAFDLTFSLYNNAFCRCGFIVLWVNYRGSTGYGGEDSIESLLGHVGTQDVQDIQSVVEQVVKTNQRVDSSRVVVMGGSHGGFLTGHLIGQYPNFYKAAVLRNPVINIATKGSGSDIPDQCYTECGFPFDQKCLGDPEFYEKAFNSSPIRYVSQVQTPVMICLGAADLRVPTSQGHEYRKSLQAHGKTVRTLCYADNSHPIIKVDCEADAFINAILWFNKYIE